VTALRVRQRDSNLHAHHRNVNQSNESLCDRLRRERERRQIALSSISANTKISASLFEGLERGDVSRWPSGIYRRSFIRAYASGIGLDPDATAKEFLEQFPDPLEPPPPAAEPAPDAAAASVPVAPRIAMALARQSAEGATAAVAEKKPAAKKKAAEKKKVRVLLAETGRPFAPGRLLTGMRRRAAAAACDGGVVVSIALCAFIACGAFWLPLGIAMLVYYLGGILLLGNTPGVCLLAIGPGREPEPTYNRPSHELRAADATGPAHPPWHFRMPAR
jgi:transcriptional regulator with XRE-family HTH domain